MRRHPERTIQAEMKQLLTLVGGAVYTLGTTRKAGDWQGTMMTPGLPDVLSFLPVRNRLERFLIIEAKAPGGRLSTSQEEFRLHCERAQLDYLTGDLDALIRWLTRAGYLTKGEP